MTTASQQPTSRAAIDAAVIVDSRNVMGQYADVFGPKRHVSVNGVISMLATFGFSVTDVFVGLATQGKSNGSSYLTKSLEKNQALAADIVSHAQGHVLEGRLVERGPRGSQRLEEKLVDVLCAIQIARLAHEIKDKSRSGVIITLSEDMDLIPSYEFARDLGVTVFAASNDIVDARSAHSKWLLLTQASLGEAAGRCFGRDQGRELRRSMARMVTATSPVKITTSVGAPCRDGLLVSHNSGAQGFWKPVGARPAFNAKVELHVVGLDWEDVAFPRLLLGDAPVAVPLPGVTTGTVERIPTPTRVTVSLPRGLTKTLEGASPGSLLPGMQVVVQEVVAHGQRGWRLVGALDPTPVSPGWPDPTGPVVVRVISTGGTPGARVRAKILDSGQEVTLQPPTEDRAQSGHEYAAVPIAHTMAGQAVHVTAIAVSSRLR